MFFLSFCGVCKLNQCAAVSVVVGFFVAAQLTIIWEILVHYNVWNRVVIVVVVVVDFHRNGMIYWVWRARTRVNTATACYCYCFCLWHECKMKRVVILSGFSSRTICSTELKPNLCVWLNDWHMNMYTGPNTYESIKQAHTKQHQVNSNSICVCVCARLPACLRACIVHTHIHIHMPYVKVGCPTMVTLIQA